MLWGADDFARARQRLERPTPRNPLGLALAGAGASRTANNRTCLTSLTPAWAAWASETVMVVAAGVAVRVIPATALPASAPMNSML